MPDRRGLVDTVEELTSHPLSLLSEAVVCEQANGYPLTVVVIGVVALTFAIEVGLMLRSPAEGTFQIVQFAFARFEWLAWGLAPFIHKNLFHFAGNVIGLYIVARVGRELSVRQYLALLLLAG